MFSESYITVIINKSALPRVKPLTILHFNSKAKGQFLSEKWYFNLILFYICIKGKINVDIVKVPMDFKSSFKTTKKKELKL